MSITGWLRPYFERRYRSTQRLNQNADETQRDILRRLLRKGEQTEWGAAHHFETIKDYEDFARLSPVTNYDDLKGSIDRMRHGEKNVLWPGRVKWYAKSSGTTNDKSKFIPVSKEGLQNIHYAGGTDCVAYYLHHNRHSRLFDGRALILGGSHEPNYNVRESFVGDLSAIMIENINPLANLVRTPRKSVALLRDFETKRDLIARTAMKQNVTNLSGVPSWMLSVLSHMLELSGKRNVSEIWPNLEVFFHGGVAFTPYRHTYQQLIPSEKMHYMETYNASEGFFGIQTDPKDKAMQLMAGYGVFYEFIPFDELDNDRPRAVPLWGVETGKNYAIVISTTCGLWRYQIGDTIRFTSVRPYKFVISGRTKSFINAFGEELMVDNAEKGLAEACRQTGAEVAEYTAAPIFMDAAGRCRHQWVIEFLKKPVDIQAFASALDLALQKINSDYEAKRSKNVTLQPLQIVVAREGLFNDWLKSKGKLGGQHKVPRLCNDRKVIDEVLRLNNTPSGEA